MWLHSTASVNDKTVLWLINPIVKMPAITTVLLEKRYFYLDSLADVKTISSVLGFFFFFNNLSVLFYVLGLKIILQNCSLIPIQMVVFAGTLLDSTGSRVKAP